MSDNTVGNFSTYMFLLGSGSSVELSALMHTYENGNWYKGILEDIFDLYDKEVNHSVTGMAFMKKRLHELRFSGKRSDKDLYYKYKKFIVYVNSFGRVIKEPDRYVPK